MKKFLILLLCLNLFACASTTSTQSEMSEVQKAMAEMMEENETTSDWFMGITMPQEKSISGNAYKVSLVMDEASVDETYVDIIKEIKSAVLDITNSSLESVTPEEAPENFFVYYRIPYASTEFYILAIYDNGMVSFEKDTALKKNYTYYQLTDEQMSELTDTINNAYKPILDDMAENPEKYQSSEETEDNAM